MARPRGTTPAPVGPGAGGDEAGVGDDARALVGGERGLREVRARRARGRGHLVDVGREARVEERGPRRQHVGQLAAVAPHDVVEELARLGLHVGEQPRADDRELGAVDGAVGGGQLVDQVEGLHHRPQPVLRLLRGEDAADVRGEVRAQRARRGGVDQRGVRRAGRSGRTTAATPARRRSGRRRAARSTARRVFADLPAPEQLGRHHERVDRVLRRLLDRCGHLVAVDVLVLELHVEGSEASELLGRELAPVAFCASPSSHACAQVSVAVVHLVTAAKFSKTYWATACAMLSRAAGWCGPGCSSAARCRREESCAPRPG